MSLFYFDIWDGESLVVDDIAKQLEPFDSSDGLAIIVRDASGPVSRATFIGERVRQVN